MKRLSTLLRYLDSVPNINFGGCAISALVIHRWLKERGEESQIVYFYSRSSLGLYRGNESYRKGKGNWAYGCTHALIQYKDRFIDSSGDVTDGRRHHVLPENIVLASINKHNWNSDFDRNWVRKIQCRTKINLSDVEIW